MMNFKPSLKQRVTEMVQKIVTVVSLSSLITTGSLALVAIPVAAHEATTTTNANVKVEGNRSLLKANVNASTTVKAKVEDKAKDRASQEIDRRIAGLTKLAGRTTSMKRVSSTTKDGVSATIQAQIAILTTLKAKIAADTSTTTLKEDIQSITKAYRIYALIIPQGHILAAADRINTIADLMTTLSGKLQVKINAAQTAGKNASTSSATLADMNAKIADARVQAAAAVTLSATLKPDNGDETIFQANKKALADALVKIKLGEKDLKTAREDANKITKELRTLGIKTSTSTAATSTTQ